MNEHFCTGSICRLPLEALQLPFWVVTIPELICRSVLGIWSQTTKDSGFVFHAVHVLCLAALLVSVVLNFVTLRNFIKRNRGLDLQLDNCHDSRAPAIFVTVTLVVIIGIIFVGGIIDYRD